MRFAHRFGIFGLLAAVVVAGVAPVGPTSAEPGKDQAPARTDAMAAVRGLDLNLFGSPVAFGATSATIEVELVSRAEAAGVSSAGEAASSVRADGTKKREALVSCAPELSLLKLVDVRMACGESRAHLLPELLTPEFPVHLGASLPDPEMVRQGPRPKVVDNGGPQAVGRGSVASVDIRDNGSLQPALGQLRPLLDSLGPVDDQTVGSSRTSMDPAFSQPFGSLATSMGLRDADPVRPVSVLLTQLVDRSTGAGGLASIKLAGSTATSNSNATEEVALAQAGGGQVDLLPGLAPGGGPLLSIVFSGVRATSRFDRSTGEHTAVLDQPNTKIRFGLPVAGEGVTELDVLPGAPVTVLVGTPLETTVSVGVGGEAKSAGGSLSSVDGADVRMLQGVKGGIDLRLGHAESSTGDRPAVAKSPSVDRWVADVDPGRSRRPLLVLGVGLVVANLVLLASLVGRRRRTAQARPSGRRW